MSTDTADVSSPQPRSLAHLVIASVGLTIVAFVCALAGFVYGAGRAADSSEWLYIAAFALLIYPYFLSREASVEGPPRSRNELRDIARFVPSLLFAALVVITFLWTEWSGIPKARWIGHASFLFTDGLAVLLALGILPFIYLFVRTQQQLDASSDASERERHFKNKVLLPALTTCLVSFSFGWAASNPTLALLCITIPISLIIILKEISVRPWQVPVPWIVISILGLLIVAFVSFLITGSNVGKVIIIGVILTLAMGVAEVCKRVVRFPRTPEKLETRDGYVESYDFYLAGSNWASILFPLLVCLIPLVIDELPVFPIFLILSIQYLHWHYWAPKKRSYVLFWFNVFLGFMLPIVIVTQYIHPIPTTFIRRDVLANSYGLLGAGIGIGATIIPLIFRRELRRFLPGIFERDTYLDYDNCFLLFLAVIFGELLLIMFISAVIDAMGFIPDIAGKATETIFYSITLLIVASFTYYMRRPNLMRRRSDTSSPGDPRSGNGHVFLDERPILYFWLLTFGVARLPIGIITALAVQMIVGLYAGLSWWMTFVHGLPICLVTMAGFTMNDIYDVEKDRARHSQKPLAIGMIRVTDASILAVILVTSALTIAAMTVSRNSFWVIFAATIGISIYSALAKWIPVVKGLVTAILCCAPFTYAAEISEVAFPTKYYLFLIAFIFGRELLLDVRDFQNDRAAGIRTLVEYLRPTPSRLIGWTLMSGSIGVVAMTVTGLAQIFFWSALLSLAMCAWLYIQNETAGLAWSRLTLLLGVIAVGFSLSVV